MILVTVGTHHQPFTRLVHAADQLAADGEEVFIQAGPLVTHVHHARAAALLKPQELEHLADEAEVIVTHAGPGSLFLAWERHKRPIVVPRDPAHREHVDDHQLRFVQTLGARATVVLDPTTLHHALEHARAHPIALPDLEAHTAAFAREFGKIAADLAQQAPRRGRVSLRRLAAWMGLYGR
jgi:UDP-N-acetylglucosamine transferase subunit ALG13